MPDVGLGITVHTTILHGAVLLEVNRDGGRGASVIVPIAPPADTAPDWRGPA